MRSSSPVRHAIEFGYRKYYRVQLEYFLWRSVRAQAAHSYLDPLRIVWVDPAAISHWLKGMHRVRGVTWTYVGRVQSGDWDTHLGRFEDLESYVSLRQHFVAGIAWEDTDLYRNATRRIKSGQVKWGCITVEEFAERCVQLDALYAAIKRDGYKSQAELLASGRSGDPISHVKHEERLRSADEIVVCIGRSGELLFVDGQHRLSIARILGIERVPVRILVRHSEWQEFRSRVIRFVGERVNTALTHALPHPDLNNFPSKFHSAEWFRLIASLTNCSRGTLLEADAGASAYFCDQFERSGFQCCALENDPDMRHTLAQIRDYLGRNFRILDLADLREIDSLFDVVIWIGSRPTAALWLETAVSMASFARAELYVACRIGGWPGEGELSAREAIDRLRALCIERSAFRTCQVVAVPNEGDWQLVRLAK